jgi:putative transposase
LSSDGFEFRCDDGAALRFTFALDSCDREAFGWAATTGGHSGDVVRDVMLAAVEQCFATTQATQPIEWLSDNGSAYIDHRTRRLARERGFESLTTPVRSPESNGTAESFVKTVKHNYVASVDKLDAPTALSRLAIAFEHHNECHPRPCNTARRASSDALRRSQPNDILVQGQLHCEGGNVDRMRRFITDAES